MQLLLGSGDLINRGAGQLLVEDGLDIEATADMLAIQIKGVAPASISGDLKIGLDDDADPHDSGTPIGGAPTAQLNLDVAGLDSIDLPAANENDAFEDGGIYEIRLEGIPSSTTFDAAAQTTTILLTDTSGGNFDDYEFVAVHFNGVLADGGEEFSIIGFARLTPTTLAIDIDKVTVAGPNSGDGLTIPAGEAIHWRYTVTNPGSVPLSNVSVVDDQANVFPVYVSGDADLDGRLDTTETWIYEAPGTAIVGPYSNVGTASGEFTAIRTYTVTDSDSSHYIGAVPDNVVPIARGDFRTQTLGGWGQPAAGRNPGSYLRDNFATLLAYYNGAIPVGDYSFSNRSAIQSFLLGGVNPILARQLLALKISIGLDEAIPSFGASAEHLKDLQVVDPGSPFLGQSVSQIAAWADAFLTADASDATGGFTASELNDALTSINENFVDGERNLGFLGYSSGGEVPAREHPLPSSGTTPGTPSIDGPPPAVPRLAPALAAEKVFTVVGATGSPVQILSVKIFDGSGNLVSTVQPFNHLTSLRVTTGDFDGDGRQDEFAVLGRRTGIDFQAEIVTYDLDASGHATETGRFDAFSPELLGNGFITTGDRDGDGDFDLAVAQIGGGRTVVTLQIHVNTGGSFTMGGVVEINFGVVSAPRIGAGDTDGDGLAEIVMAVRTPAGARVLVFDADSTTPVQQGAGFTWDFGIAGYHRGAFVAVGEFDPQRAGAEIVLGSNLGGHGLVDVVSYDGHGAAVLAENGRLTPFGEDYQGAVRVAVGKLEDRNVIVAGQDQLQSGKYSILARESTNGANLPFEEIPAITALTANDGMAPVTGVNGSRTLGAFVAFANLSRSEAISRQEELDALFAAIDSRSAAPPGRSLAARIVPIPLPGRA